MRHPVVGVGGNRSEEHTSELQSPCNLVSRLLLEKTKTLEQFLNETGLCTRLPEHPKGRAVGKAGVNLDPQKPRERQAVPSLILIFFFNDTATTEIYTLSLHDALPI